MALSPAALLCLETNISLKVQLFNIKSSVKNTPAARRRNSEFYKLRRLLEDPDNFFVYMRITRRVFEYIYRNTEQELQGQVITLKCLSAREKLFITLRYLVTGNSMNEISLAFCIGRSTACKIITSTLKLIWKKMSGIHLKHPSKEQMPRLANQFYEKWKFPNCVAALGGKYIMLMKKKKYASEKRNAKFSVVLSAAADADSRFLCADVSDLVGNKECLFSEVFVNCGSQKLPGTNVSSPYVVVANSGFPLKTHIMRPFPGRCLSEEKTYFNERIEQASVPIHIAFEVLTKKFRFLSKVVCVSENHSQMSIKVCCLLYNIAKDIDEDNDLDFIKAREYGPTFRHTKMMKKISKKNKSPSSAMMIRVNFQDYFMNSPL